MKRPLLVNAMQMAVEHPKTFSVPNTENVRRGSRVKVSDNRERFWVLVTKRIRNVLVGTVDNDLVLNKELKCGDEIQFHVANIYQVLNR